MKVIDLLNKIANNEEVPNKIKYSCRNFNWTGVNYYCHEEDYYLEHYICLEDLNYSVKIIEEQKELKPIEVYKDCHKIINATENESELFKISCELMNKTNEIINKYNELIERIEFDD